MKWFAYHLNDIYHNFINVLSGQFIEVIMRTIKVILLSLVVAFSPLTFSQAGGSSAAGSAGSLSSGVIDCYSSCSFSSCSYG